MKKAKTEKEIKAGFSRRIAPLITNIPGVTNNVQRGRIFGVSGATISRWCSGTDMPPIATACAVADYFNVSVDWLLLGSEPWRKDKDAPPPTISQVYPELNARTTKMVVDLIRELTAHQSREK